MESLVSSEGEEEDKINMRRAQRAASAKARMTVALGSFAALR
jgi:hypothetical protein